MAFSNRLAFALLHGLNDSISPMDVVDMLPSLESFESSVTRSESESTHTKIKLPVVKTEPTYVRTLSERSVRSTLYTRQIRCV